MDKKKVKKPNTESGYALWNCFIFFSARLDLPEIYLSILLFPLLSLSLTLYILYLYLMWYGKRELDREGVYFFVLFRFCRLFFRCAPNSQLIDQALVDAASRAWMVFSSAFSHFDYRRETNAHRMRQHAIIETDVHMCFCLFSCR